MIGGREHPYVRAAIEGEIANLAGAVEGERNQTLFRCTAKLASLGLREGEILHHLKPVAETIGLRGKELYTTVKSGVRAGNANPRQIPDLGGGTPVMHRVDGWLPPPPEATDIQLDGSRTFFIAGAEGPGVRADEIRRHIYRRNGLPVRIKVKRQSGDYANWYSTTRDDQVGWQPAKPKTYVTCPYVGNVDPFDPKEMDLPVYWPEGEKDCDTLGRAGLPAFTFGGTGDGLPDGVSGYLRNRHVVILVDNDAGGRDHAIRKAAIAHPVAKTARVVEFPELPPKGDVSDYLQTASISDLENRASEAPLWTQAA